MSLSPEWTTTTTTTVYLCGKLDQSHPSYLLLYESKGVDFTTELGSVGSMLHLNINIHIDARLEQKRNSGLFGVSLGNPN